MRLPCYVSGLGATGIAIAILSLFAQDSSAHTFGHLAASPVLIRPSSSHRARRTSGWLRNLRRENKLIQRRPRGDAFKVSRGGASKDKYPHLFAKIGIGALFESAALLGILKLGQRFATKYVIRPMVLGLPLTQAASIVFVIFGSSFVGSVIDGSLSVASNQALNPNQTPGDPDWYSGLKKPKWNPPGWLFPIMWLIVSKPTQAMAVARILKADSGAVYETSVRIWKILGLYTTHLALGDAWNKVFFDLQCTGRGAAVISVFAGSLAASTALFGTVDTVAGQLLLPTCGWVTIATALNWSIYKLNKPANTAKTV